MNLETIQRHPRKLYQWLKDQIVQSVPEADGLCEFDCKKPQCVEEEWATCERRIQKARGELWPAAGPRPRPSQTPGESSETAAGNRANSVPQPTSSRPSKPLH